MYGFQDVEHNGMSHEDLLQWLEENKACDGAVQLVKAMCLPEWETIKQYNNPIHYQDLSWYTITKVSHFSNMRRKVFLSALWHHVISDILHQASDEIFRQAHTNTACEYSHYLSFKNPGMLDCDTIRHTRYQLKGSLIMARALKNDIAIFTIKVVQAAYRVRVQPEEWSIHNNNVCYQLLRLANVLGYTSEGRSDLSKKMARLAFQTAYNIEKGE